MLEGLVVRLSCERKGSTKVTINTQVRCHKPAKFVSLWLVKRGSWAEPSAARRFLRFFNKNSAFFRHIEAWICLYITGFQKRTKYNLRLLRQVDYKNHLMLTRPTSCFWSKDASVASGAETYFRAGVGDSNYNVRLC